MSYFTDAQEVYHYLGGVFREADGHPEVGPVLKAAGITLRLDYTGPDSSLTVVLKEPGIVVIEGDCDLAPDVRLATSADNGDKFWRGEYNVAVGPGQGTGQGQGPGHADPQDDSAVQAPVPGVPRTRGQEGRRQLKLPTPHEAGRSMTTDSKHYRMYIDGAWVDAADDPFEMVDPATEKVFAAAARGRTEHADLAVAAAKRAHERGEWRRKSPEERHEGVPVIGDELMADLLDTVRRARAEGCRGLLLRAEGRVFLAGAEAGDLQGVSESEARATHTSYLAVVHEIEDLDAPTARRTPSMRRHDDQHFEGAA
jgi:hypothetical protein